MAHELASIFIEQCGKNPKKRAFRIMYPDLSDNEALKQLRCSTLCERRENICKKTMNRIEQSGGQKRPRRIFARAPGLRDSS